MNDVQWQTTMMENAHVLKKKISTWKKWILKDWGHWSVRFRYARMRLLAMEAVADLDFLADMDETSLRFENARLDHWLVDSLSQLDGFA